MITLPGYQFTEQIYESVNTLVYRGVDSLDNQPLIFKFPAAEQPTENELKHYRQEFDILKKLNIPGVIRSIGLEYVQARPVLLLEDIGGQSLDSLLATKAFTLDTFFSHAIHIADILQAVHTAGAIHKDLNPSNIILNAITGELQLIDFGISAMLPRESVSFQTPSQLEGTLAYISPEQTGRIARDVDYRTDFYSLGVTFYEMLVGHSPFAGEDALSLIHAHLAREATPPHSLNEQIPEALSRIIMKLLHKNAEDRYQSAHGLKLDLLAVKRGDVDFKPGQHDVSGIFRLSQKLYGRDAELAQITGAVERVAKGAGELLLVSGDAGVGKTSLIRACRTPLTAARGYFCEGKFDQLQQATPYLALKQALSGLARQILTESDEQLAAWKTRLQKIFGQNGQLIINFAPGLEKIVGPQPPVAELPAQQARNRLEWVFWQTLQAFCQPTHPLVLFLDDLQWADADSLDLLFAMITNAQHLLIIGAYRDNEINNAHLLHRKLTDIQNNSIRVTSLNLLPLTSNETEALLRDTLPSPLQHAPLAKLAHEKTAGNPFFIGVFLERIHKENLLYFSTYLHGWVWDEVKIKMQHITENVAQLMTSKLADLPENTRDALQIAACIGHRFELESLQAITPQNTIDWSEALQNALREDLIVPLSLFNDSYCFTHDRIQQASHEWLSVEKRQQLHWDIGWYLWEKLDDSTDEQALFTVANHLNEGYPAQLSKNLPDDTFQLARLNLKAGQAANDNSSHDIALHYFQAGIALLTEHSWSTHYELTTKLYFNAAEVALLRAEDSAVLQYTDLLLQHLQTPLEKIKVYLLLTRVSMRNGRAVDAFETGKQALALLGLRVPNKVSNFTLWHKLTKLRLFFAGKRLLLNPLIKPTTSHNAIVADLLATVSRTAFYVAPALGPYLTTLYLPYVLKHGAAPTIAYILARQGGIFCHSLGAYKTGYQFAKNALEVFEAQPRRKNVASVYVFVYTMSYLWRDSLRDTLTPLRKGALEALQYGERQDALICFSQYCYNAYICGEPLDLVKSEMEFSIRLMHQFRHFKTKALLLSRYQSVIKLFDASGQTETFDSDTFDSAEFIAEAKANKDKNDLLTLYGHLLAFHYLFRHLEQALNMADLIAAEFDHPVENTMRGTPGQIWDVTFAFYGGLTRLTTLAKHRPNKQREIRQKIKGHLKHLKEYARNAPMNWQAKYLLLKAEYYRVQGKTAKAAKFYKESIEQAKRYNLANDYALANEITAYFYLTLNKEALVQKHMQAAHQAWLHWGAKAKAANLKTRYPQFIFAQAQPVVHSMITTHIPPTTSTQYGDAELDFSSILKAAQIVSQEIVLEHLLENLMQVLMENVGAQRSILLLLDEHGDLRIEASQSLDATATVMQATLPTEEVVPLSMVRYVARTHEIVVTGQESLDFDFSSDAYLSTHRPQSALCLPVLYKGELCGVLYLENRLNSGVFTLRRQEALQILSTQAAIAIENARLYQNLEQRVAIRTAELQQARQEALDAMESKALFLANMSHEIRTPMNAVLGMGDLLSETALNEEQREYVQSIKTSGETLLTIVNDILDFSKIEAGKMQLEQAPLDLRQCIESALDMLNVRAVEKRLSLVYRIAPETPQTVLGDTVRLRQILLNLLSNAIKFTEQGEVFLTLQQTDNNTLRFEVSDTGIGIAADMQPHLFQDFAQTDVSITRRFGGTGLGLSICKMLSRMMGGDIGVNSVEGEGSTFYFTIQAAVLPDTPHQKLYESNPAWHDKQALLIADTKQHQSLLREYVTAWGFVGVTGHLKDLADACNAQWNIVIIACHDLIDVKSLNAITAPLILIESVQQTVAELPDSVLRLNLPLKPGKLYEAMEITLQTMPRFENTDHDAMTQSDAAGRKLKILIVDDSPINQRMMISMLSRLGHESDVADNGETAFHAVAGRRYDVVLMDLQMPVMDGLTATRKIKAELPPDRCPYIVALTAEASSDTRRDCQEAGMDDYLGKPIERELLLTVLARAPNYLPATNSSISKKQD